ncbi:hypothetical protein AB0O75_43820 [Streptomyces sp. NPDC088921]|uniref:hypothetical protein n=1 Tax=unclassified Streptomyces TaxID=2593676 RepID=UPI00342B75EB
MQRVDDTGDPPPPGHRAAQLTGERGLADRAAAREQPYALSAAPVVLVLTPVDERAELLRAPTEGHDTVAGFEQVRLGPLIAWR